jgi:hypothetical protein
MNDRFACEALFCRLAGTPDGVRGIRANPEKYLR